MPIIATAGHVDHGKSTLVRALTGTDPDRWAEEKARGLTIDLGFAWADLGLGEPVGFVDVPGHERFVKNMLAGMGAVDTVLFVVAADEGWMPQSEEHAAVVDLLGARAGVVALTRRDLVDDDLAELARLEVEERTEGTVLEGWPIVPVAAPTGLGMEALRRALAEALRAAGPAPDESLPRLWVDRAFVVAGAGVVVTGTLAGGAIGVDDRLVVRGRPVRVRAVHRHGRPVDRVGPGNRVALNLAGVERGEVERGDLVTVEGGALPASRLLAAVRPVRGLDDLPERGAYQLHLGTAAVPVRVRLLDHAAALLTLDRSLPVRVGDRFVLRETGRRAVVGGGIVLDPFPRRRPRSGDVTALLAAATGPPEARAQVLVDAHGRLDLGALAAATGGGRPPQALIAGRTAVSGVEADELLRKALELVDAHHAAHPLRDGIPKATLASALGVDETLLEGLIGYGEALVAEGETVRRIGFEVRFDPAADRAREEALRTLRASLAVPRASQLGVDPELLHALVRRGELVRVGEDLVYLPEQLDEIVRGLEALPDGFTVAAFRDAFGLSRRHAVPLLEWLDASGVTSRRGDLRRLRRRPGRDADDAPTR